MKILQQKVSDNLVKIFADSLNLNLHIEEMLDAMQKNIMYEITFLNISFIPSKIIIRLHQLKDKVKIILNKPNLKYYLRNLGFSPIMKENKYLSTTPNLNKIQYLALGGSAGSLKKFIDIIKYLPSSNLSIFIVMHQKSDLKSSLADILQRKTKHYKVIEALSDIKVMPSTIYIAPPNKHMIVVGGFIFLTDDEPRHFSRPSISNTFFSLAKEYKDSLLSILVCGYGADGSDSLKDIRKNGGLVIIEQLYECKATPMLENAINTKEYDYILSIDSINELLYNHLSKTNDIDRYLDGFLLKVYEKYGYDYRHYHRKHVIRRIEYFLNILSLSDFKEFETKVLSDINIFKDMFLNLSVNVTTFFRNPDTFKQLRDEIFVKFKEKNSIKIWCAGCSSGEEPYSIAIILKELGILEKSLIYATDFNNTVLQYAKNAIYSNDNFKLFSKQYINSGGEYKLEKYFDNYDDFHVLKEEIKDKILFFRHNLATDGVLNEFQLIFCRNVIIYFDNTLKQRVFNLFDDSLEKDGILVLGESETYSKKINFTTLDKNTKIYKKIAE